MITAKQVAYAIAPALPMPQLVAPIFTSIVEAHGHFGFTLRYPNGQRFEIVVRELVPDDVRPEGGG
jgi:hypothetical protein